MAKETTEKTLEEMTFDELAELATLRIHSALLVGGGREMKRAIRLWMRQAILWIETNYSVDVEQNKTGTS
jgi:hypothetical protein